MKHHFKKNICCRTIQSTVQDFIDRKRRAYHCRSRLLISIIITYKYTQTQIFLKVYVLTSHSLDPSTDSLLTWVTLYNYIITLHYLEPSLFHFLCSESIWNPFLVTILFVTDLGWECLWITEREYIRFIEITICWQTATRLTNVENLYNNW